MKTILAYTAAALALSVAPFAVAEEAPATSAVVKAATSIEAREPVGEAKQFKAGERIYVWSKIEGAEGQQIDHVWKKDGKEIFRAKLDVQSKRWRTNSRMQSPKAGSYVVDVLQGEQQLGSVQFTVE